MTGEIGEHGKEMCDISSNPAPRNWRDYTFQPESVATWPVQPEYTGSPEETKRFSRVGRIDKGYKLAHNAPPGNIDNRRDIVALVVACEKRKSGVWSDGGGDCRFGTNYHVTKRRAERGSAI
jgi:hypothetical protein